MTSTVSCWRQIRGGNTNTRSYLRLSNRNWVYRLCCGDKRSVCVCSERVDTSLPWMIHSAKKKKISASTYDFHVLEILLRSSKGCCEKANRTKSRLVPQWIKLNGRVMFQLWNQVTVSFPCFTFVARPVIRWKSKKGRGGTAPAGQRSSPMGSVLWLGYDCHNL